MIRDMQKARPIEMGGPFELGDYERVTNTR